MKIEKLTIHNIASLSDAEIDFTKAPLKDTSLFLIDGETGAGKSTILDAICLALYGKTPRMEDANNETVKLAAVAEDDDDDNELKTKDTRQLLRRGAKDGFVEFTFIGNDKNHYLAKWMIKHSGKNGTGKLQAPKQFLKNLENNDIFDKARTMREQIEKVVGLRFDQFCRTTLLAQGDFTRFLYSKEDEKADILEKLTGTEQFARIGSMVYTIYDEVKDKYKNQKIRLEQFTCLTDEEVANMNAQLKDSEAEHKKLLTTIESLTKQQTWLSDYEQKRKALEEKQEELKKETAETKTDKYKQEAQTIKDYNETETVRGDIRQYNEAQAVFNAESSKAQSYKLKYFALLAANRKIEETIKQYEQLTGKLTLAVNNAHNDVDKAKKDVEAKAKETDALIEKRNALNPKQLNADNDAIALQLRLCDSASFAYKDFESSKKTAAEAADSLKSQKDSLAEKQKTFEDLQKKTAELKKDFEIKNEVYEKLSLSLKDWAKETRKKLAIGDTCPVCGQKITSILHDDDFKPLLTGPEKERKEAKNALDDALTSLKSIENGIKDIQKSLPRYENKAKQSAEDVVAKRNALKACCEKIEGLEYNDAAVDDSSFMSLIGKVSEELNKKKEGLNAKLKAVQETNTQIDTAHKQQNALQKEQNNAAKRLEQCEKNLERNQKNIESLQSILANSEISKKSIADTLKRWQAKGGEDIQDIAPQRLQSEWTQFVADIAGWERTIKLHRQTMRDKKANIEDFLKSHAGLEEAYLMRLAAYSSGQINKLSKAHHDKEENLSQYMGSIKTLQTQIADALKVKPAGVDDYSLQQLQVMLGEKNAAKANLENNITEVKFKLKQDDETRKRRAKAEEELKALKTDYEKWNHFNDLLGSRDGKRFKMIAESFILGHLLRLANQYLEQFTDRFTLTCRPGSLVILINDKYQGNMPFGSNTLSGGESFLVSLSLALGLSQLNTSRNAVDTLFIDEGFGTLDGDYLNAVMDALGKLHQVAGRRVGIISHVEILSTLIPTQIQVKKVDPTRSIVLVGERKH